MAPNEMRSGSHVFLFKNGPISHKLIEPSIGISDIEDKLIWNERIKGQIVAHEIYQVLHMGWEEFDYNIWFQNISKSMGMVDTSEIEMFCLWSWYMPAMH